MKAKIVVIAVVLFVTMNLISIELCDGPILPQELIYYKLPEKMSIEVEELFDFYHDSLKEFYSLITVDMDYKTINNIFEKFIAQFSMQEVMRFEYLEWFVKQEIPQYFREYQDINSLYDQESLNMFGATQEEINKLTYLPCKKIELNYWLEIFRRLLHMRYTELTGININVNDYYVDYIIGEVIYIDYYNIDNDIYNGVHVVKIQTNQDIVKVVFPDFGRYDKDSFQIKLGKKYLIGRHVFGIKSHAWQLRPDIIGKYDFIGKNYMCYELSDGWIEINPRAKLYKYIIENYSTSNEKCCVDSSLSRVMIEAFIDSCENFENYLEGSK